MKPEASEHDGAVERLTERLMAEAGTLRRFAVAEEYSASENAIFDSASGALNQAAGALRTLLALVREGEGGSSRSSGNDPSRAGTGAGGGDVPSAEALRAAAMLLAKWTQDHGYDRHRWTGRLPDEAFSLEVRLAPLPDPPEGR